MSRYDGWDDEDEERAGKRSRFRLRDFLRTIRQRRNFILLSSIIFAAVVVLLSLLVKNSYESTVVVLPPKQDQSISALLSGPAGNLSALAGGGALGGLSLKNPNELYVSLLESRTLSVQIIDEFGLEAYYRQATMQKTIKALRKHVSVELGKDNLLRVSVRTHDAELSSRIANAFVDQLHSMNTGLALTDSAQRRQFYQDQLDQEKMQLAKAETDLQETQSRTGIIQPTGQADMVSRSISTLRSQITSREAELQSLKTFDAPENPDYMQLQAQIGSLQGQLSKLENSAKTQSPGDIEVPTAQLPKSALEYARKYREVQQHEQVYALLLKQFEAAKIDESKTAPVIQIVDCATPAELPSGPPRWVVGLGALLVGLLVNIGWCALSCVTQSSTVASEPARA